MADVGAPQELEVKLRLARETAPSLLRHPAVAACARGRAARHRLVSTYFDTADLRLARAGIGLRIRRDGRRWLMTVKGPPGPQSGAGLAARPEYEWPLGGGAAMPSLDPAKLAATTWRDKLAKAQRKGLAPRFAVDVVRTSVPLSLSDGTSAVLSVDVGEVRARGVRRRAPVCEMELELVSGSVASLLGFAQALASDLPMAVETRSKAERGVQLLSPAPPRPARAQEAMPPPDGTAADAVAAFARSSLRQIADNADGLLADDDPEWVHQMRIGTRRLRACLALVRDHVPAQLLAPVAEDARWLADALATARDLDVLATETLPAVMAGVRANADAEAGRALRSLAMRIGRRRRSARAHARAAVASPRFARLVLAGAALAATPHLGAAANTPAEAALAADARAFARPLLAARHGRLVRRGERMLDGSPVDRHAARIAAKKLRYATEFFADLFPGKRTRAYRNALADLQDLLGALNDATVAVLRAREFAGADSAPAATLQGYAAARFAQLAPEIAAAWKRFAARRTFWDRR